MDTILALVIILAFLVALWIAGKAFDRWMKHWEQGQAEEKPLWEEYPALAEQTMKEALEKALTPEPGSLEALQKEQGQAYQEYKARKK
jgi:hypothetical protein